jgi:hypothetical protein
LLSLGLTNCVANAVEQPPTMSDIVPSADPPPETDARSAVDAGANDGPTIRICAPRMTQVCTIDLGWHNGVHDCAKGTQRCEGDQWGPCIANDSGIAF